MSCVIAKRPDTPGRDHRLGKGTWQTDSSDNGRTWSKLRQVDFVGVEHDDRCYATDDHTIVDGAIYTSLREFIGGAQGWQCKFIQSPDNGESWRVVSEHINVPEHNSVEKGFEYVGEDRIVCIGSEGPGRRHVLQTHSDDLGQTWKRWTDALPETGVWDRPRIWTLAHLKGGDQWWKDHTLIGVGNTTPAAGRKFPRANAVYISTDRGATWKMLGGKPIDKFYPDGGYGDLVYDQATDTFVYVSYRGTGIHGSGEIVQYRFRLGATDQPLSDFRDLVRTETWTEKWPGDSGEIETRSVTAEIWKAAMQASLDAQGLPHMPASADSRELRAFSAGKTVTLSDVLVGEVWLASGQSNMGFSISKSTHAEEARKLIPHPQFRRFKVGPYIADGSVTDIGADGAFQDPKWRMGDDMQWREVNTEKFGLNWISAVAAWFAHEVRVSQDVPVGLIGFHLWNKDGLPAGTFRTDDWPLMTRPRWLPLAGAPEVRTIQLHLTKGGTTEEPAVFDGKGMTIDLGTEVSGHIWKKEGDLWTSDGPLLGRKPVIAGQTAGLFVGEIPITIPRDLAAEKLHPDRKSRCYFAANQLKPGQMGYDEHGSVCFRWPEGTEPGSAKVIFPGSPGMNCVSIACSHIVIRNITAKYAGNDGFNIHGDHVGIRLENVKAFSNADEGISAHGTAQMDVIGAEVAWNGSAAGGIADVNRCVTSYRDCRIHDNAGAAFYFSGKSHTVADTLIYNQSRDFFLQHGTQVKRESIEWRRSRE